MALDMIALDVRRQPTATPSTQQQAVAFVRDPDLPFQILPRLLKGTEQQLSDSI